MIESGILATIQPEEKKLQEAMFEVTQGSLSPLHITLPQVISSEASYLKSLNILISHFIQSPKFSGDSSVLSKRDQRILFSEVSNMHGRRSWNCQRSCDWILDLYVPPVRQVILVRACSERFLSDLESRWQVKSRWQWDDTGSV